MPVEIKELVIRTVVGRGPAEPLESGGASGLPPPGAGSASTDEIVQECVRQVLQILDRKRER